jgi:organic radical activating enzyme
MNIEKIENGFTNVIDIGRYCIFIYTKKDGVHVDFDAIYEQLQYYNTVVITGDEPLLQREEVCKLMRKLVTNNNTIQIELHTNGVVSPLYYNEYKDNIVCYVYIDVRKKLDTVLLKWYVDVFSKCIFIINNIKQLQQVEDIVNVFGIKKKDVYIKPDNNILEEIKYKKYNIAINVDW